MEYADIDLGKLTEEQTIDLMKRCYSEVSDSSKAVDAVFDMLDPIDKELLLEKLEEDDLTGDDC